MEGNPGCKFPPISFVESISEMSLQKMTGRTVAIGHIFRNPGLPLHYHGKEKVENKEIYEAVEVFPIPVQHVS